MVSTSRGPRVRVGSIPSSGTMESSTSVWRCPGRFCADPLDCPSIRANLWVWTGRPRRDARHCATNDLEIPGCSAARTESASVSTGSSLVTGRRGRPTRLPCALTRAIPPQTRSAMRALPLGLRQRPCAAAWTLPCAGSRGTASGGCRERPGACLRATSNRRGPVGRCSRGRRKSGTLCSDL